VFFAPTSIEEALKFVGDHSEVRVLGAATDLGVQINKGKPLPKILLSLHLIRELYEIKSEKKGLTLGARVTLSEMRKAVETTNPEFSRFLDLFASPQIKNVATLVGNVANASPIGDTLPFLLVSDGKVHLASFDSKTNKIARREVPLSDFYLGYKKLALKSNELITHISFSAQKEMVKLYKVSSRKDLDISTVSAAFFMKLKEEGSQKTVEEIRIALGGVAATPIRVFDAEKEMIGQEISKEFFEKGANLLASQIKPLSDLRGSQAYRKVLVKNLFRKLGEEMLHG
jgi:xanthine dehydrogenase small subunit